MAARRTSINQPITSADSASIATVAAADRPSRLSDRRTSDYARPTNFPLHAPISGTHADTSQVLHVGADQAGARRVPGNEATAAALNDIHTSGSLSHFKLLIGGNRTHEYEVKYQQNITASRSTPLERLLSYCTSSCQHSRVTRVNKGTVTIECRCSTTCNDHTDMF